ncbi:MAG TPA: DUF4258 domain-containing protein [Chitinophagales bacterium]|jgi:hypothetical protein|nr:DUF4258 domain-containing protein [Chitinophagales bacterium]
MKRIYLVYILIGWLICSFLVSKCRNSGNKQPKTTKTEQTSNNKENQPNNGTNNQNRGSDNETPPAAPPNAKPGTDEYILYSLRTNKLIYTDHARCRMDCRHITEKEVKEILGIGKINHTKSHPDDLPCPSYAIEGKTSSNKEVRFVFALCEETTKVVTVIQLKKEFKCNCD